MIADEFSPVTPGEMLKEEFLVEYRLSQNQLAKAIGISPNLYRRNRQQPAAHYRRYRTPPWPRFRQQSGILDEFAIPL